MSHIIAPRLRAERRGSTVEPPSLRDDGVVARELALVETKRITFFRPFRRFSLYGRGASRYDESMRTAITVRQPWAGAIFERGKNVENRSWTTSYRGRLWVHSGAAVDKSDAAVELVEAGEGVAWTRGVVLGSVELVDIVRDARSRWAFEGAYHWIIEHPIALREPEPARGRLGLWTLDD